MLHHFSHILENPINTTELKEQEVVLLSQIVNNTIPANSELLEIPKEPKWRSIAKAYMQISQDNKELWLLDIYTLDGE